MDKLGKKIGTMSLGNSLWIKSFEKGAKIKKKNQGELTLDNFELSEISCRFRKIAKLYHQYDLDTIAYKFPKAQGFIERIKADKVSFNEMEKIREGHRAKLKIVEALEKGNNK